MRLKLRERRGSVRREGDRGRERGRREGEKRREKAKCSSGHHAYDH
jgi:hypothetical protein